MSNLSCLYDRVWLAADGEVKDIGASIMTGDIQHPSWSAHLLRIDLRIQRFFSRSHRPNNKLPIGIDHHAIARVIPRLSFDREALFEGVAISNIGCVQGPATADDKDASLSGNMPQRREPGFTSVRGSGDIELRSPGIEGRACQRQIMLPANQSTDGSKGQLVNLKGTAIPLCPDQAFRTCQQERAMFADDLPVRVDRESSVL